MKYTLSILLLALNLFAYAQEDFSELEKKYNFIQVLDMSTFLGMENAITPKFIDGKPGLDKYLADNIKHPKEALANDITGIVVLSYIIDKQGKVSNIQVMSETHELLNNELIRVLSKSGPWIPAKKNGKYLKISMSVSFEFINNKP